MRILTLASSALLITVAASCGGTIDGAALAGDESTSRALDNGARGGGPGPETTNGLLSEASSNASWRGSGGSGGSSRSGAAGSGSATKTSTSASTSMSCDFRALVQMKCGNANCHGAPASSTGLDLTSASPAMRLAGRHGPGECADKLLIDPDRPEESALYLKVTGYECGVMMPLGGSLSRDEQDCVLSWIENLGSSSAKDAGAPDSKPALRDAGSSPLDAGVAAADAGPSRNDAAVGNDASIYAADAGDAGSDAAAASRDAAVVADSGASVCDFRGLVQSKCGNANCHGGPTAKSGLDLTSASLATRVAGRTGPGACSSNLLIDPAAPEESVLYLKVTTTQCGSKMPLGGSLSASEQACILEWIEGL